MNLAKHMEAVFVAATLLLCAATYQSNEDKVSMPEPAPVAQVQQVAQAIPHA
jgi:hypothetical protein